MARHVLLFRALNVGGKNIVPMKELQAVLAEVGGSRARTYIQSGNAVVDFAAEVPRDRLAKAFASRFGFEPEFVSLQAAELETLLAQVSLPTEEGKCLHFYFPEGEPDFMTERAASLAVESESFELLGNVFALHAPDGVGRSKLARNVDACLGVPTTARNLNTIRKLIALAAVD